MKLQSRNVSKRMISFLLVILSLFSMFSIGIPGIMAAETNASDTSANLTDASLGASGTAGDSSLLTELQSTTPYIKAVKSAYKVDTPVLVTADTFGKYPNAVIKLKTGTDASAGNVIYDYSLTGHEGQTIDLLTGNYHADNASSIQPYLNYDMNFIAVLYPDASSTTVLASATINIDNAVRSAKDSATYVEISRSVFRYGEGIVVKAGADNNTKAWVGVYDKGADHTKVAPHYILPIGTGYSTNYNRSNRWIVHGTHSLVNKNMELAVGDYTVKLISAENPMTASVLCSADFSVKYSLVHTYKSSYGYGEDINTHADIYRAGDANISNQLQCTGSGVAFRSGPTTSGTTVYTRLNVGDKATLVETSGGTATSNWAKLKYSSYTGYMITWLEVTSDSDVKIDGVLTKAAPLYSSMSTSSTKVVSSLPAGTPYNYLDYGDNSFNKVQVGGYTGYIYRQSTGTAEIQQTYRLHSTSGKYSYNIDSNTNARAALYPSSVTPASGAENNGYFFLNNPNNASNSGRAFRTIQDSTGTHAYAAGTYKIHLFGDSGYTSIASKSVTISANVTATIKRGAYQVADLNDGFAKGKVAFEVDPETSYGYVGNNATYIRVYWAGSDGKPLAGYGSFNPVPLTKDIVSFDIQPYTIIPEGAAGLVAYVEYNGVQGAAFNLSLPSGCKTYTGLNSGIISEFNVLSDTKVGNTNSSYHYDDHYVAALTDIANNGTNSQAIVIDGDITNSGTEAHFALIDSYAEQVETSTGKTLPPIYGTHGNTDDANGLSQFVNFVNTHGGSITEEKLYYSLMVDGYKYIFLASDVADGTYSTEQIQWLDAELADNEQNNSGKPVFIYSHYAPTATVLNEAGGKISNTDEFAAVTAKYNNVICFTGHGLASMRSLNIFYAGDASLPVVINASSTARTRRYVGASNSTDGENFEAYDNNSSEGLYIKTYDDKTAVLGRDFVNNLWIPEAQYVLLNQDVTAKSDLLLEFGESAAVGDYLTNPNGRSITATSSDTNIATVNVNGKITSADIKEGYATVTVSALPTDTYVVTRTKTNVRVVEKEDYSYYLKGTFDNWGDGYYMKPTSSDGTIVSATVTFEAGTYELKLKSFDDWYATNVTVNDEIASVFLSNTNARTRSAESVITLVATGGTYTFTYNTATTEFSVTHTPFTEDELNAKELFELADTTDPYLYTSKEEYALGESIFVTAQGGTWVGIYTANTTSYGKTYSYYYYTDGKDGVPVDIRTLVLNGNTNSTDPTRSIGSYKAVLFEDGGYTKPMQEVYFDVVNANENVYYNNRVSTDKEVYFTGESIKVSGYTDRPDLSPWIAVVEHGKTPSTSTLKYWYYLPIVGEGNDAYVDDTPLDLISTSQKNKNVQLAAGKYDIYIYRTNSYNYPSGYVTIEVIDAAGSVSSNKSTYDYGEDIVLTMTDLSGGRLQDSWIGIYDETKLNGAMPTSGGGSQAWYYVYVQDSYAQVIQDVDPTKGATETVTSTGKAFHGNPGTYTAVLFTTDDYKNPVSKVTFTVSDKITDAKFDNGAYLVDNLTDGFANGRVAVKLSETGLGLLDEGDVVLYWADANGKPLEGYTALAKHIIDKNIITFDMYPYTVIPEGAAGLVAYVGSYKKVGSEGYFIKLPDGCQTYGSLDNGDYTEFQIVSDTHIYSPDVTHYSDGSEKLDNTQAKNYSNSHFQTMLADIAQNSTSSTGIFIVGDVTNNGFQEEFDMFHTLYNESQTTLGVTLPQVYVTLGNHDSYAHADIAPFISFANSLGADITADAPYYAREVAGYTYIFLAGDNSDYYGRTTGINPDMINCTSAEISDEQLAWLDAQLAENEKNNPDKPVFILLHQQLYQSIFGTFNSPSGVVNSDEVKAILSKYNNVIYLSGHTHHELNTQDNISGGHENLPVVINTSSLNYPWTFYRSQGGATVAGVAEGYYVRVYDDKTVFLGRNFTIGEWVPDATYIIYNKDVEAADNLELVVDDRVNVSDYVTNTNNRELTFTTSDPTIAMVDENGNITAGIPGEAVITVFAAATDTEVITIEKVMVDVRGEGYPSKYGIAHLYDWDNPEPLIFTADKDVVTATVELAPGSYFFAVRLGDEYFGTTAPTVDFTEETLVLDGYDFVNLQATGGYYTFTYRISTKELDIEYEPLDLTETGENTATIYVDFKNSDFTSIPYIYIWDDNKETVNKNIGPLYPGQLLEGPNAEGYYYRTFKYDESYQFIITDGKNIATDASAVHTESEVYAIFEEGVTYTEEKPLRFWVDLTPNDGVSDPIDRLYPVYVDGFYYFYLPSGLNAKAVKFYVDEGLDIKISFVAVKPTGTSINVSGGVTNANTKYRITDLSNKLIDQFYVRQSSSIPSLYTYTDEIMHRETGYDKVNTEYTTSGTYKLLDSSATVEITERELLSLEGIMNDDWTTANNLIGKYSYDLTLAEAQALFEGASASKEYSLIAVNDDESRLRDLTMLELANAIGIEYTSIVQPIDLYNNGYYIGYYLLVEKPAEVDGVTIEFTENNENADFTSDKGQSMIITTADADASEIEALWNAAEEIIYNPDATYEELSSVIDVESFAKMYIIQEFAKTYNAGTTSYTIYYKDGKFHASTAWDFENSLGQSSNDIAGMTGGKFADDATLPLDDPEGWWANSKLMENGELTAQAALCQNEIFWNVVKAEWNEVFYDVASGFTTGEATAVAKLTGKFKELYNLITKSAAMDEVQWGIIKNDPVEGDNRVDTGDTHNDAVLYLNNYYYNRLQWMDETLSQGYTLATPTLKTEKQVYAVNEEIKLTATISSSGMLTYEFYNEAGDLVYTETSDKGSVTYKFSTSEEISEYYTVVITSERAESPVSADALVITEIYELKLEVEAPEELPAGAVLNMTVTSNSDEEVMYILKDKEGNTLAANYTGQFSVITTADEADEYFEYVIEASTTIGSIEYTASKEVTVAIFKFDLSVMLNAEKEVDAGQTINLFALAKSEYELTYTFYNADNGAILDVNKNGYLIINTSHVDADTIKNFYVEVSCEAFDMIFTAKSDIIEVKVVAVTDVYNVTIYFKSTSTLGYRPIISTTGAVMDLKSFEMNRDIYICKNETETASYFWYKAEFTVSKRTPSAYIRILSSRYAMEVQANLLLTEDKTYYFAVDDLNGGTEIVDLTDASPDERNWCYSAAHMVYDPRFDSAESLAEVSARIDLRYVGDTTADGVVNIRDATYIQKGLADILTMSTTDREVADVDYDGHVTIKDVTLIQKEVAGLPSKTR